MNLVYGAGIYVLLAAIGPSQEDKVSQTALRKFKDDFYRLGAKEDEKVAAINALSGVRTDGVVKTLAPLTGESSLAVRVMATRVLGQFTGVDSAQKELLNTLRKSNNLNKKFTPVRIEALRWIGMQRIKEAGPEIDRLIDDKDVWVSKAAIDAAGRIRQKASIEPLLRQLRRIEGSDGNALVPVNPFWELFPDLQLLREGNPEKKASEREFLREPILGSLRLVTRQSFPSSKDFEAWWTKNKATFVAAD